MIKILNIGMNHETAPVDLRECIAKDPDSMIKALDRIRGMSAIQEGIYVSTCNRIECLCTTNTLEEANKSIISMMSELGSIPEDRFTTNLYRFEDIDAVRHIFRVASSLDSMVVGEPQILGQIKDAYYHATRQKTSGVILNRLMHKAFHVAKRIRTETGIGDSAVSISYAAVELAKKIFYELQDKAVLLIGAGEMADLTARYLISQGVESVSVANRTFERAVQIADAFSGNPIAFEEISAFLEAVDIVISSTASSEPIITYDMVKSSLKKRRGRPLFLIDIAVPRDVDPKVNELDNTYVYDIDDLKGVIEINKAQRRQEGIKAARIIDVESIKFEKWLKTLDVVPTIISMREKVEAIRQAEIKKSMPNMGQLSEEQKELLETLTISITEKIINDPILVLKTKADRPTRDTYLDITNKLFKLDKDDDEVSGNGH